MELKTQWTDLITVYKKFKKELVSEKEYTHIDTQAHTHVLGVHQSDSVTYNWMHTWNIVNQLLYTSIKKNQWIWR